MAHYTIPVRVATVLVRGLLLLKPPVYQLVVLPTIVSKLKFELVLDFNLNHKFLLRSNMREDINLGFANLYEEIVEL